ncbi:ribokinase [Sphingomonas sp. YR710]|jgi:ribokinase|uniref:ribokinase n=1 Tax=Sphingomonas sp. YR710 TaxID=1882773 RepID=UPI00087E2177|nr:ribokinase [Sphingomonas sp. YR710]SDD70026.1 ribokinase [Sphingomonas sp. YR710]
MSVTVFGSVNMDMVLRVDSLPLPGETVAARGFAFLPGGKGANQAVASARYGASTRLIGAIGDDQHGTTMREFLGNCGVDLTLLATLTGPTGLALICVDDCGENQIVVVPGANALVAAPGPAQAIGSGASGRAVALAQLELPVPAIGRFLRDSRDAGAITILNTAPALAAGAGLFEDVDILILNETELEFYLGHILPNDPHAIGKAACALLRDARQTIIITLGGTGIVAIRNDDITSIPAPSVNVVDTVGAGDCFCGVLAAALSEGRSFADSIRLAVHAAALAVQKEGAATSMPTRAEIEAASA